MTAVAKVDRLLSQDAYESATELPGRGRSFGCVSDTQLKALSLELGFDQDMERNLELQRSLFYPWGAQLVPKRPAFPSMIGDDHSPYEYSLAFSEGSVELRILFEAQANTPTLTNNQAQALLVNQCLRDDYQVNLQRLEMVRDLFLPAAPQGAFSLWHAVCLNVGQPPQFKAYLNPAVQGLASASDLVHEAMQRLGFGPATEKLIARYRRRGCSLDPISYFSVDLSSSRRARAKIYFAHPGITAEELDRSFEIAPTHTPGQVRHFCDAITARSGSFDAKPLTSCLSFVSENAEPTAITLHVPIAHYAPDDEIASERIISYLKSKGMLAESYSRALKAFSSRPLGRGPGLQSYASERQEANGSRVTVYLSPELFTNY